MGGSGKLGVEGRLKAKVEIRGLEGGGVDESWSVEVRGERGVEERHLRGQSRVIKEGIETEGGTAGSGSGDKVDRGSLRSAERVVGQEGSRGRSSLFVDGNSRVEERVVERGLVGSVVETEVLTDGVDGGRH